MKSVIEWFDSIECPEPNRSLIVHTLNNKCMCIKDCRDKGNWEWLVSKYAINWWAYQDEIKVI